jgi:hypothetical protein
MWLKRRPQRCDVWPDCLSNRLQQGGDMDVDEINACWGWTGLIAVEVLAENEFGNLLLLDEEGAYWWLSPQHLCCQQVARNRAGFEALAYDQAFLEYWYSTELVRTALAALGPLVAGRKYCMTVPLALGGSGTPDNMAMAPMADLIRCAGEAAEALDSAY